MAAESVTTSAETLYTASAGGPNLAESIIIQNQDATSSLFYLVMKSDGDGGFYEYADPTVTEVTAANGVEIAAGSAQSLDLKSGDVVRVISDGTIDVRYTVLSGS